MIEPGRDPVPDVERDRAAVETVGEKPMPTAMQVPVTIDQDAADRIDELGMRREFEQMLEHALQTVPGLVSVQVSLALPYDTGDEAGININAYQKWTPDLKDPWPDWSRWKLENYPTDVWRWFQLMPLVEE